MIKAQINHKAMTTLTREEKRNKALKALSDRIQTKAGAQEVAAYFIAAVPWTELIQACDELEIKL